MQIELFITNESLKDYVNLFVKNNNFTILQELKGGKFLFVSQLTNEFLKDEDVMFSIGKKESCDIINKEIKSEELNRMDYVYFYKRNYSMCKITNCTISWKTTSKEAKAIGNLLKKNIDRDFYKGLRVIDEEYIAYNKYLEHYYWSEDILKYKDRLYKSGGVIQVEPIIGNVPSVT
jgi:hypothetical protein